MEIASLFRADGSPATWLNNARGDHHPGHDGEYRHLVTSLSTAAVADLAMLALDGGQMRVGISPVRKVHVALSASRGGAFGSQIAFATGPSTDSVPSPPEAGAPSRAHAREGAPGW